MTTCTCSSVVGGGGGGGGERMSVSEAARNAVRRVLDDPRSTISAARKDGRSVLRSTVRDE